MAISSNFPNLRPSLLLDFANTQALDPRVTFSRSTIAPFYDGKTSVLAEQNTFLYSQDYTNVIWTKNGTTITAAATTAPDGTITGQLISASGTNLNAIYQAISFTNGLNFTVSFYAKSGTKSVIQIDSAGLGSGYGRANFDITNGVLGTVDALWTASIVSAGNGWYRCIATFLGNGSTGNFVFSMQDSTTAAREANSTAGNLYLWGIQAEQRSSVTAYNATTTTAITNYIPQLLTAPINAPRFDYNPTTGESLGLLIEQSSTNTILYSQNFSNAAWVGTLSALTTANIAPDGTQTASLVTPTTTGSYTFYQVVTATGTAMTYSIYAKKYSGATIANAFILRNSTTATNLVGCSIDYDTGVLTQTVGSGGITSTSVGNGWWRISMSVSSGITIGNTLLTYVGFVGGTYTANTGAYFWGAQLEALAFPTSYIATTSAQVTRAIDYPIMTGTNFSSWYNISQGTVLVLYDFIFPTSIANAGIFSLNNGSSSTRMDLRSNAANNTSNGTALNSASPAGQTFNNTLNKASLSYIVTSSNGVINGGSVSSYSLATMPQVTQLQLGNLDNSTFNALNGHIRKFAYYPLALTGAQNQALTGS